MRRVLIVLAGLVLASEARTEEFVGAIKKVEGNNVTIDKTFGRMPSTAVAKKAPMPGDVTIVASDDCKITQGDKFDPATKKFAGGEALKDGLKNPMFKKAIVMARITVEMNKITDIKITQVLPNNEFAGLIKKVEGTKITFRKTGFPLTRDDATVETAAKVKVVLRKFNPQTKAMEDTPLEGGLKNEKVTSGTARAQFVLNDENLVSELRILEGAVPVGPGPGGRPVPLPPGIRPAPQPGALPPNQPAPQVK